MTLDPVFLEGYTITRPEIAHGGSGLVHEALAPDGKTKVAIKVLDRKIIEQKVLRMLESGRDGETDDTEFTMETRRAYELNVERFKIEYQTILQLNHPNIAKVHKIGFHDGHFYMVSEFVEGKPIAEYVRRWKPVDMIPLFVQFLEGLDYIHRHGLIHLDLKSENILVTTTPGAGCKVQGVGSNLRPYTLDPRPEVITPVVKIIDFGLAMTPMEYRGSFLGSAGTMAPEVALGLKDKVDARSDLYSAGRVLYYCITWGFYPVSRPAHSKREVIRNMIKREAALSVDPPSLAHHERDFVPEYLDKIVMHMIAYEPENRYYGNARAVINALNTGRPEAFKSETDTRAFYFKPERNKYIGREREVQFVKDAVISLVDGVQPGHSVFRITGDRGLGKTRFIAHAKAFAEENVENLSIHSFSFPIADDPLSLMIKFLSREITDNAKPILVFVDDAHELKSDTDASNQAASVLTRFMQSLIERGKNPKVYSDIKPAMLVYSRVRGQGSGRAGSRGKGQGKQNGPWTMDPCPLTLAPAFQTITLKPFSKNEVMDYLSSTPVFHKNKLSDKQIEALFRQTGGNPGELVDALETIDSKGLVFDAAGEIVFSDLAAKKKQEKGPPPSTHDRLLEKYKGLSDAEREVVELIACMKFKPFLPQAYASEIIALNNRDTTAQTLSSLVQKGLVESDPNSKSYTFFNSDYMPNLVHDVMDEHRRGLLHAAIAESLEAKPKKRDASATAVLLHRAYCQDGDSTIRNCISLGRHFLFNEGKDIIAIELFRRAESLLDATKWRLHAYIFLMLTKAFHLCDNSTTAWNTIQDGMNLVRGKSTHWKTIFELEQIHYLLRTKKIAEAKPFMDDLKSRLSDTSVNVFYLRLLNYEGRYYYEFALKHPDRASEYMDMARACCERSEALEYEKFGTRGSDTIDNNSLYLILHYQGEYASAAQKLEKQLASKKYGISALSNAYLTLAEIYRFAGKYDIALSFAKKALESAKRYELVRLMLDAHAIFAYLYYDMDEYEKSVEECNRQIAAYACIENADSHKLGSIRLWSLMGHCYKEMKVWDKAAVYFEEAVGSGVVSNSVMSAYLGLGEVYYHLKKYDREFECFDNAEKMLSGMPDNTWVASHKYRIVQLKIETHLAASEIDKARELMPALERLMDDDPKRIADYNDLKKRLSIVNR